MLPLLGLLAVGALEANRGGIENRRNRVRGENIRKARDRGLLNDPYQRDGAGDTKFNEAGALYYGGADLSTNDFLSQRYQQDLQTQAENAQMERQKVAIGPAAANAALNKRKYDDLRADQSKQADYNRWLVENHGTATDKALIANPFVTPQVLSGVAGSAANSAYADAEREQARLRSQYNIDLTGDSRLQAILDNPGNNLDDLRNIGTAAQNAMLADPPNAVLWAEAAVRGKPWITDMDPAARAEVMAAEDGLRNMQIASEYFSMTNAIERTPLGGMTEKSRQQASTWLLESVNFLRNATDAKSMQEADFKFFEKIAGDPDSWFNLTDGEKGRMGTILQQAEQRLDRLNRKYGLNPSGNSKVTFVDPNTGATLKEAGSGIVDDAVKRAGDEATARQQGAGAAAAVAAEAGRKAGVGTMTAEELKRARALLPPLPFGRGTASR
ncbi:MAG: hypothetical protein GY892_07595 [Shimia sp.]|nr:hypothetical protein [Shimia sp.]